MHLLKLLTFIIVGLVFAIVTGLKGLQQESWYLAVTSALLAIGLYASTYGIVLEEAKQHVRLIFSAITVGVLLKALFIGGSLALVFGDPFYLVLGIVVAQIDPLSVASLMKGSRMSAKAKTILASWASFDDPITVLLALYLPAALGQLWGNGDLVGLGGQNGGFVGYMLGLGLNMLFIVAVFALWRAVRRRRLASFGLLGGAIAAAVSQLWMLGIAGVGLFLRPDIEKHVEKAVSWALRIAALLLGLLLIDGVNVLSGIALGVAAYVAQIVVGYLMTRGLNGRDRTHIAFAQQNGITAIILALLFETQYPGTVAVVAPAIIVINVLHGVCNRLLDKYVLHVKPTVDF